MLSNEDLQTILEQFDDAELKRQGIFGILIDGIDSKESYIRANKEGLILFAIELLKAARDTEHTLYKAEDKMIRLNYIEDWIDENSSTIIHFIEPIADKQKTKVYTEIKPTWVDRIMPIGCSLMGLILLSSLVVGLITILNWIF